MARVGAARAGGQPRTSPQKAQNRRGGTSASGPNGGATLKLHKAINRQLTEAAGSGGLAAVLAIVEAELPVMNGVNLATAVHRIARLCSEDPNMTEEAVRSVRANPLLTSLLDAIEQRAREMRDLSAEVSEGSNDEARQAASANEPFPAQCSSIVAWSCASLWLQRHSLLEILAQVASPRLQEFQPYEVTNMLWAYAKLGVSNPLLFRSAGQRLLTRAAGEFKAQCLSLAAWSFATARWRDPSLFHSLAGELVGQASQLKPQEISNALWAFAKSRIPHVPLFQTLGDAAADGLNIWRFKPQELSNTVWAFATVGLRHPPLFSKACSVAIKRSSELIPQNVANILWAYSKMEVPECGELFPALLDTATRRLSTFKPQEISAVAQAAAKKCPGHVGFFSMAAKICGERLGDFSRRSLADLNEALAAASKAGPMAYLPLTPLHKDSPKKDSKDPSPKSDYMFQSEEGSSMVATRSMSSECNSWALPPGLGGLGGAEDFSPVRKADSEQSQDLSTSGSEHGGHFSEEKLHDALEQGRKAGGQWKTPPGLKFSGASLPVTNNMVQGAAPMKIDLPHVPYVAQPPAPAVPQQSKEDVLRQLCLEQLALDQVLGAAESLALQRQLLMASTAAATSPWPVTLPQPAADLGAAAWGAAAMDLGLSNAPFAPLVQPVNSPLVQQLMARARLDRMLLSAVLSAAATGATAV